jgi:hypothetical protein
MVRSEKGVGKYMGCQGRWLGRGVRLLVEAFGWRRGG